MIKDVKRIYRLAKLARRAEDAAAMELRAAHEQLYYREGQLTSLHAYRDEYRDQYQSRFSGPAPVSASRTKQFNNFLEALDRGIVAANQQVQTMTQGLDEAFSRWDQHRRRARALTDLGERQEAQKKRQDAVREQDRMDEVSGLASRSRSTGCGSE